MSWRTKRSRVSAFAAVLVFAPIVALFLTLQAQPSGPDAAYAFSDGTGAVTADLSGNGNTAALVNGVAWISTGRFGTALAFDGLNDAVQLPLTTSLALTTAFTLEAWLRPAAGSAAARQIVQVPGGVGDGLRLTGDGRPRFAATFSGGSTEVTGPAALPADAWSHVGLTYNGALLRLYVDGTEVATQAATGSLSGDPSMWIGRGRAGNNAFSGTLDEVRIYRRALTAAELALDRHTPVDVTTPFQVAGVTPASGATAVITTPISVTFTRPVNVATVTSATLVLRDAAQSIVPATVAYNAATRTAILTPNNPLAPLATHAAGVLAGESGVLDTMGNSIEADSEWSFTTAATDTLPSAAYAFSEEGGLITSDASGNGHTGVLINDPSWTTGQFGAALRFDGVNDGVRLPTSDALRLTTTFTLEAWVQPWASGSAQQIVQMAGNSGDGLRLTGNGRPRFTALFPGGVVDVTGPASLPLFTWTHVAVSYDGAMLRLFFNGAQVATRATTGGLSGSQAMWIGSIRGGGTTFNGVLDEVRIYRRTLNAGDIAFDRNTPVDDTTSFRVSAFTPQAGAVGVITTPVTVTFSRTVNESTVTVDTFTLVDGSQAVVPSTVGYNAATRTATLIPGSSLMPLSTYTARVVSGGSGVIDSTGSALSVDAEWSFQTAAEPTVPSAAYALDEGSGLQAADASGNGHTGTLVAAPVWTTAGQYSSALVFDGFDDGVALPQSDALTFTSAFSLEAWVNPSADTGIARQIVQMPGVGGDGLRLTGDGRPRFTATFPSGVDQVTGPSTLSLNTWTHVAVTYDGAVLRLYVNGTEVATRAVSGGVSGMQAMWLGRTRLGARPFPGALDEIRVYRRALAAADIVSDMTTPIGGSLPQAVSLTVAPVGASIAVGGAYPFSATVTLSDGTSTDVTDSVTWTSSNQAVANVNVGMATGIGPGLATLTASLGSLTATGEIQVADGSPLPPDPRWVAPPVSPTVATQVNQSTRFLFTGFDPIQRDVAPETIDPGRAAVVRGHVTTRDGASLAGVLVTVADHPEYGTTLSRADGMFDLAVNGGVNVTIRYQKGGYLPVDRSVEVPRGDFAIALDAALVPLDAQVTTIVADGAALQVAQGSTVSDASGTRQATVVFPQGTTATFTLPDGTTQPLTTLHLRATEYTVGPNGLAAMPAPLPPASAYTYAVELSVDEAISAGATTVTFSAPLPVYVQNFLGFPVGVTVPSGYYDRAAGAWVPSTNGVVLKVLSPDAQGLAAVDLDGDGLADDGTALAAIGVTDAERGMLATIYAPGQTLWRVPVVHFSSLDFNWPFLPSGANANPDIPPPQVDEDSGTTCAAAGSIIECQDQVLGEQLAVAGTSFTLNYRSDRVPGRVASRAARIPLAEMTTPAGLIRIELEVSIAGRQFVESFPPTGGLATSFVWDGRDVYGREVEGFQQADIRIRHMYNAVYAASPFAPFLPPVFGQPNPFALLVPSRLEYAVERRVTVRLGSTPRSSASVAGWSLSAHHVYDPGSRTLLMGDGQRRTVQPLDGLRTIADASYASSLTIDSAGSLYFVQSAGGNWIVRKTTVSGAITTVAMLNQAQPPNGLLVDQDGTLTYGRWQVNFDTCLGADDEFVSILRRSPGGTPESVATVRLPFFTSECDAVGLDLARAADGTVYLSAGRFLYRLQGNELQLLAERSTWIQGLAATSAGDVYVGGGEGTLDRYSAGGSVTRFAGTGTLGFSGDGGPALQAQVGNIYDVAVGPAGSVLFLESGETGYRVRQVTSAGIIRTVAGGAPTSTTPAGDGSPASALQQIYGITVGQNGALYVVDTARIYEVRPDFRGPADVARRVVSEDGGAVYEFNEPGRHVRTRSALSGAVLFTFTYDAEGLLTAVTDGDGLVAQIERNGGVPTAIVAPFGQRTTLAVDGRGWLASVTAPGGRTTTLTSTTDGLLTHLIDAKGQPHNFTYDADGRLGRDDDPAGGSQTLARFELADGWLATRTTEMGRMRRYQTNLLPNGKQLLTITEADATQTIQTRGVDGANDVRAADGTRTVTTMAGDPRFGLQAPRPASVTVTTPAGLTLSRTTTRTATVGSAHDVGSLQTQTETTVVNGRTYSTVYDAATRTFTMTTPTGRTSTSRIDAQGRVTRTQVGALTPVDFAYNGQGRLTTIAQGPRQSAISYDAAGRPSTLTDALTRSVTFGYDTADRVTQQTLPDTWPIGFGYDANDNVTSLTPPDRPAHAFTSTPVDLTTSYTPPVVMGTGPTLYAFNLDREPTSVARPDGQTTSMTYAPNGRLTAVNFSRGTLEYAYDAAGRVAGVTDPGGVGLTFSYDGALPLGETWSGLIAGAVTRTFSNNFDVASESVTGTTAVAFGYDADRLLTQAGALTIARDDATGLVTSATLGTTIETVAHNAFGELSRQTSTVGGTEVFDVQYVRDALGRITHRIERVDGITRTFEYGYNLSGRLGAVRLNGTVVVLYTYDANGNRTVAEGEAGLFMATYDAQDRLLAYGPTSYTYTANGEFATKTTAGQTTGYIYDTLGNLLQVTKPNGQVITYIVDGRGRRVQKAIDGVTVKGWLYADQLRPIAELDGTGAVVSRFVYGTKSSVPEYVIKNGETYRIVSDHLGTPRVVVHATTGAIVQRLDVQAFGELIGDTAPGWQPFGFAGGLYDPDTGLVRFGARDYDPIAGRWTAKDPLGLLADDSNLYGYVLGDPVNLMDPHGLYSWDDLGRDWMTVSDVKAAQEYWQTQGGLIGSTASGLLSLSGLSTVQESGETFGDVCKSFGQKLWAGVKIAGVAGSWYLAGTTQVTGRVAFQANTSRIVGLRNKFGAHSVTDKNGFYFAVDSTFHRLHVGPWKTWFTK